MLGKLRLFTSASASAFPNPARLRLFINEKGIAEQFDEVFYDMSPVGEQRGWRHLKMSPLRWKARDSFKIAYADAIAA